jgi:hypothetical protein
MSNCFTSPDDWKCFEELCSKYPRNIGQSKVFRITVEAQLKLKNRNSNQSIKDFADDSYAVNLDSDKSLWISTMKTMSRDEIKTLLNLLEVRAALVSAAYRNSQ